MSADYVGANYASGYAALLAYCPQAELPTLEQYIEQHASDEHDIRSDSGGGTVRAPYNPYPVADIARAARKYLAISGIHI